MTAQSFPLAATRSPTSQTSQGVPCPCGTARRAFVEVQDKPGTIHITEIAYGARLHYHRRLMETYYFLELGGPDAKMQLDDQLLDVHPGHVHPDPPGSPAPRGGPDEGA